MRSDHLAHMSEVNHGIENESGQTKDYKIGICCFSAWHISSSSKMSQNQDNVPEFWNDMSIPSTHGLLFR